MISISLANTSDLQAQHTQKMPALQVNDKDDQDGAVRHKSLPVDELHLNNLRALRVYLPDFKTETSQKISILAMSCHYIEKSEMEDSYVGADLIFCS